MIGFGAREMRLHIKGLIFHLPCCGMDPRTQALDKLAEVLERRLVSSKRSLRFRFSACADWALDKSDKDKVEDVIPSSDVRQCRDAVKVLLGSSKVRAESVQRSTLRHLILLKELPSAVPLHDKRVIDIVEELRKRLRTKLPNLYNGSASASSASASTSMPLPLTNASASTSIIGDSVSKTPRHDLGASISHEECLRRRVLELEKELEDTKQRLEKMLHETPSV